MRRWIATVGLGLLFIAAPACGSWLHRAYSGTYCAHDRKYVVGYDTSVDIQSKHTEYAGGYVTGCNSPCSDGIVVTSGKTVTSWETDLHLNNIDDVKNLIADLQHVEHAMEEADREK